MVKKEGKKNKSNFNKSDKVDKKEIKKINKELDLSDSEQENSNSIEEQKYVKQSRRTKKIDEYIEGMEQTTGVLYVAHLPWGTNEALIKKYFEQFGTISRFILPRSKHTGRIKGYSFIEYETMEIAKIAANTMNNFILFDRIIKCDVISDRSRYNKIFRRWKRQYKYFNKYNRFVTERNKKKSMKELKENVERYVEKENKKREKLRELGLNYDFPGFKKILESSKLKSKLN
jgi:nucleolar protein 15